jgi:hypothetical protein
MSTEHRQFHPVGGAEMAEILQSRVLMPTLLTPDRQVVNSRGDFVDRDRQNLIPALERCVADLCAYSQKLWNDMTAMPTYLLHDQPPSRWEGQQIGQPQGDLGGDIQPTTTTSEEAVGAADDADGPVAWSTWIAAYAAVTSVLAGAHGDSGFGMHEAHALARLRQRMPSALAAAGAEWATVGAVAGLPETGSA